MESKRLEIRISLPQPALIDKTINAITKWKARRTSLRRSKSLSPHTSPEHTTSRESPDTLLRPALEYNAARLPTEIFEQVLAAVGNDISLHPPQLDRLKFPSHFLSYFQFVDFNVRARNQTLRNCRLVSTTWNEIASKYLNTYLVIRNESWKDHLIWRNEGCRRQVRHVWIIPPPVYDERIPNPWQGLFAMIFTGFPNLETLYASFPGCYDTFYSEQFLRLHVPPNLRILGLDGPVLRGAANPIRGELQFHVLKLFPKLETLIEVGSSSDDILILNGFIHNVTCSSIKMMFFPPTLTLPFFSRMQSLSLTGGHLVQDESIVNLAALCPSIRHLRICGFDRSFTMRGPSPSPLVLSTPLTTGLERLLEKVGSGLESLQLAIRQSEQLWGHGTHHLCHILARTCSHLKSLSIGEEDSYNRPIRSTSCCRDLFDLAKWENLVDCHLCVYPGRGGCLDQSDGSLSALVESARAVALRNSNGLGTIIRIKGMSPYVRCVSFVGLDVGFVCPGSFVFGGCAEWGLRVVDYMASGGTIWVSTADTMTI